MPLDRALRLFDHLERLPQIAAALRYAVALLLVGVIFAVREALGGTSVPSVLLFEPAIILIAFLFGWGPAVLATVASAALVNYIYVEPRYAFGFPEPFHVVTLGVFVVVSLFAVGLIEALRSTARRLTAVNRQLVERERDIARSEEQLQTANEHLSLLLREIQHRIKNNCQVSVTTLRGALRRVHDPAAREVLESMQLQLLIMARSFDRLRLDCGRATISASSFVDGLADDLRELALAQRPVELHASAEDVRLPPGVAQAVGLIVNELVTNALKHAFPDGRPGTIDVRLSRSGDGRCCLEVSDDGVGSAQTEAHDTRGRGLVEGLSGSLNGSFEWIGPPGMTFRLLFRCAD